jgi:hypothetical protein
MNLRDNGSINVPEEIFSEHDRPARPILLPMRAGLREMLFRFPEGLYDVKFSGRVRFGSDDIRLHEKKVNLPKHFR